ncbi:MAG: hypothetical protein AAGC55_33770 [Myxococcota bacterium]
MMAAQNAIVPFIRRTRPGQPAVIFVEGFPGLGKTSQAQKIVLHLSAHGYRTRWVAELDIPHPITGDRMLREMDTQTWATAALMADTLERWRALGEALRRDGEVLVLEASLLQMCVGKLHQMDVERDTILAYLDDALGGLAGIHTYLIYLYHGDWPSAFRTTLRLRGRAFRRDHLRQLPRFPYLERRGLRGIRGLLAYSRSLEALYDEAMAHPRLVSFKMDTTQRDWAAIDGQLRALLGVGGTPPPPRGPARRGVAPG